VRILIIGNKGSTGKRYSSILKMLGAEIEEYDIIHYRNNKKLPKGELCIIACPTNLHCYFASKALDKGYKKILVEKPFSKSLEEIEKIMDTQGDADIRVICNWKFSSFSELLPEDNQISYNFYNHGNDDEPLWDLCQLVYLQKDYDLDFGYDSPFFTCSINGFNIGLWDIEKSYYRMLISWLVSPEKLWDIKDAYKMSKKVLEYLN
jgi:hypothetical protein